MIRTESTRQLPADLAPTMSPDSRTFPTSQAGPDVCSPAGAEVYRPMVPAKVRPPHLERWAVVYVRQSTAHQVLENRESTALQYNLRRRAIE